MKRSHISIILILFLSISCVNDSSNSKFKLKQFSQVETQVYDLDTISELLITGKKGTSIYFKRKYFDVLANEKITLTLKEFYSFEDLFFNNIRTITHKNELLESSGVFYIDFKTRNKKVDLKEGSYIKIGVPGNKLIDNDIFSGNIDSLNNMQWKELESSKVIIENINIRQTIGNLSIDNLLTDTIGFSSGDYYKVDSLDNILYSNKNIVSNAFYINDLEWINLDRYVNNVDTTSFELIVNKSNIELSNYNIYVLYDNLNSFNSLYYFDGDLKFNNVPFIKEQTSIIVFGFLEDKMYADKVKLEEKSKIKVNLKEIDSLGVKSLLRNN